MPNKLPSRDPYRDLQQDLYSIGLFDPSINGFLSIIEINQASRMLLLERKFLNEDGEHIKSGYYLIQVLNAVCDERHLIEFRQILEDTVRSRGHAYYMEVDPILIAPDFTVSVVEFLQSYRTIERRKPIQAYTY